MELSNELKSKNLRLGSQTNQLHPNRSIVYYDKYVLSQEFKNQEQDQESRTKDQESRNQLLAILRANRFTKIARINASRLQNDKQQSIPNL